MEIYYLALQVVFMYQDGATCPLQALTAFPRLARLELWGGHWYQAAFLASEKPNLICGSHISH